MEAHDGSPHHENPFLHDFFKQRRGTIFCLCEPVWRARDARAVVEILSRLPATESVAVATIYAKSLFRWHPRIDEILHLCDEVGQEAPVSELRRRIEEKRVEKEEESLAVPERGPVIVVGRPESYASYGDADSDFRRLIERASFPNRFRFMSDDPLDADYRKIIDERTGRIYEHQDFQNSI